MRLEPQEIIAILEIVRPREIGDIEAECQVYLFGSRVDDTKKGGDIDLLVVVDTEYSLIDWKRRRLDLLVELKSRLGDRKIDLVMTTSSALANDPFLIEAAQNRVRLK